MQDSQLTRVAFPAPLYTLRQLADMWRSARVKILDTEIKSAKKDLTLGQSGGNSNNGRYTELGR